MLLRPSQFEKAELPIDFTVLGISAVSRALQLMKARPPISVMSVVQSMTTSCSAE